MLGEVEALSSYYLGLLSGVRLAGGNHPSCLFELLKGPCYKALSILALPHSFVKSMHCCFSPTLAQYNIERGCKAPRLERMG
jgi:hypothetical protein